jgi:L-aminopeptidase/D-esterase-like protein
MGDETKSERVYQRSAEEVSPRKGEDNYEFQFHNGKLTYDTVLEILAAQARRGQTHFDQTAISERERLSQVSNVALQALQNAVETANLISKQAVRHGDISIDRQWNKEPSEAVAEGAELRQLLSEPSISALQALIVDSVGKAVGQAVAQAKQ